MNNHSSHSIDASRLMLAVVGGSFALGDHDKPGDTFWRSLDAVAVSSVAAQTLKLTMQRERP